MFSILYGKRGRSAVLEVSGCARALRLLASLVQHQFVSVLHQAVAVAAIANVLSQFYSLGCEEDFPPNDLHPCWRVQVEPHTHIEGDTEHENPV